MYTKIYSTYKHTCMNVHVHKTEIKSLVGLYSEHIGHLPCDCDHVYWHFVFVCTLSYQRRLDALYMMTQTLHLSVDKQRKKKVTHDTKLVNKYVDDITLGNK